MRVEMDAGNTRCKWRLIDLHHKLICRGSNQYDELRQVFDQWTTHPIESIWVASVRGPEFERELIELANACLGVRPHFARASASVGGLKNAYEEPAKLGVDRWLAMLAAWDCARGALCVIDCGSAITIDLVDHTGLHHGGYIVPGVAMMRNALLAGTDRVRFEATGSDPSDEPGKSTAAAVTNGTHAAAVGLIEHAFALMSRRVSNPSPVITGGDALTLAPFLQIAADYQPDLVLDGLSVMARLETR